MSVTAAESSRYTYAPLDTSTHSIRLIEILPGLDDDPIECRIQTLELCDQTRYVALSYTWGPVAPTKAVCVNEQVTLVRENLYWALHSIRRIRQDAGLYPSSIKQHSQFERALRNQQRPGYNDRNDWLLKDVQDTLPEWRLLWIDALCINQSDAQERNHQVNMMGQIFSEAYFVISWLGPVCPTSANAIRTIKDITDQEKRVQDSGQVQKEEREERRLEKKKEERRREKRDEERTMEREEAGREKREEEGSQKSEERREKRLSAQMAQPIRDLFTRSYWKRLWVVQEFVLARHVFFLCGTESLSLPRVHEFHRLYKSLLFNTDAASLLMFRAESVQVVELSGARGWDLGALLFIFIGKECEDSRDKVYGLLGMTASGIKADYTKDLEDTYLDLLAELLKDPKPAVGGVSRRTLRRTVEKALGVDISRPRVRTARQRFLREYNLSASDLNEFMERRIERV